MRNSVPVAGEASPARRLRRRSCKNNHKKYICYFCNQSGSTLKFGLLCKDLPANPCREMFAGGLCSPLASISSV
jgi:hypothetical protein